ncbi:MAG: hypothetical protein IJ449_08720 [Clostridia bacterium]|nr:hypothetical protein [Clostridia bacterium]
MKKTLSVLLAGLILSTMAVSVSASNFAEEQDVGNVRYDIPKITGTWAPDGVASEGEYYEVDVQDSWMSAACGNAEHLEETQWMPFTLGVSWDETYLYTIIQFYDANGHDQTNPDAMWDAGCIHVGCSEEDGVDTESLKWGCCITSDTAEQYAVTWIDHLSSGWTAQTGVDYIVINDNNNMTYEFRVPFAAFSKVAPAVGETYGYCLSLCWGNGTGERQHTQIGAGCSGGPGEQAARFPRVTLVDAPVVEEEAVEGDVAVDTEAPTTADAGIVAAAAAMIIAGAGVVLNKKK